jgi:hypothetical protein
MCNEVNKTIQSGRLQCWYYWWEWFSKYTIQMASDGMIYVPSFMRTGSGILVLLRLLPQQSDRPHIITNGKDLWYITERWPQMAWHIHAKFHDNQFRSSCNIKVITSRIWEAIVLVLLMRDLWCMPLRWTEVAWYINITSFMKIGTGIQANFRFCLSNLKGCNTGITDRRDLWWYTF